MATDPKPYALLDAMWKAFNDFGHIKTPAVNGKNLFPLHLFSTGGRSSAPRGPRPAGYGRGRGRECCRSRLHSRRDQAITFLISPSMISLTLGSTIHATPGHLKNITMQRVFAVCVSLRPTILPSEATFSRPLPATLPSEKPVARPQLSRRRTHTLSFMRAAGLPLNSVNLVKMTLTDGGKHARLATAATASLLARTTT